MKIAIVDDEARCLADVVAVAKAYAEAHKDKGLVFESFSHPEDLLEAAERIGGYDIYVLDVIMPSLSGIELGKKLRAAGYDGKIMYLTSSAEYAYDSFQVKAFEYMIKPVRQDAFFKAFDEALASIAAKKDKTLLVKTKDRSIKLSYDGIMYAEFANRSITYYLVGGRTVETTTLRTSFSEATAELIADRRFCACGQSMVVNLDHVTEVENDAVVFDTTYRAPLGEKNCRKLRGTWSSYLFDGEG